MRVRRVILTILLIISFLPAFSQEKYSVGLFAARNTKTLAESLTKDINSDEEKVLAIHYWITHHIKYDVKQALTFGFEPVDTRRILRRRKAVCTGYSELFNELCAYVGIKSVSISGYSKDVSVDLGNKFYLAEHMWNAVQLNGQWTLVDATWDAGCIKYYKRPLGRRLLHYVTFGKTRDIIYKPHFKFAPKEMYFRKPGTFFKTDHFAFNPTWQMLPVTQPIQQFEQDSSAYYLRFDESNPFIPGKFIALQDDYARLSDEDKYIENGLEGNEFNKKSNYDVAVSWWLLAKRDAENLDLASKDTFQQLRICDSVLFKLKKYDQHIKLSDSLLTVEKKELMDINNRKKEIFKTSHAKIKSSISKVLSGYRGNKKAHQRARDAMRRSAKSINKRQGRTISDDSFYDTKYIYNPTNTDSAKLPPQISLLNDSAKLLTSQLQQYYIYLDELGKTLTESLTKNISGRDIFGGMKGRKTTGLLDSCISNRIGFFDDLDYPVIIARNKLVYNQLRMDSALFLHDTSFVRYYYYKCQVANRLVSRIYIMHNSKIMLLKQLKRALVNSDDVTAQYEETKEFIFALTDEHLKQLSKHANVDDEFFNASAQLTGLLMKEKKALDFENYIEKGNSLGRSRYINRRDSAMKSVNRKLNSTVRKLQTAVQAHKTKYTKLKKST